MRSVPAAVMALLLPFTLIAPGAIAVSSTPAMGRDGPGSIPAQNAPARFVPEWSWPLDPEPAVVRGFQKPPRKWQRGHRGVDLSAGPAASVPVLSPADGVVSFAGTVVDRGVLSIDHGGGRVSSFEPVDTELEKGRQVRTGDVVAHLAGTAAGGAAPRHCGAPCLHWGVRVDGEYVDPLSFVMDRRPSVLLPLGA